MFAPTLSDALLFEWIAANTISYSVFFGKLSALMYILDVQNRTNNIGKWILIGTVALNVCPPKVWTYSSRPIELFPNLNPGHNVSCHNSHDLHTMLSRCEAVELTASW